MLNRPKFYLNSKPTKRKRSIVKNKNMKDLLILLLIIGLTWGGYKGLVWLGNFSQSEKIESDSTDQAISDNEEKRLNQSAIREMKKGKIDTKVKKEVDVAKSDLVESPVEKTNGQKAMETVRGTRLDIEGKPRSKADFYKDSNIDENAPYERENTATVKNDNDEIKTPSSTNETDINDQKVAMVEKGKALAGKINTKGKTSKKSGFNIEKGSQEVAVKPHIPREYSQPTNDFIPSRFVLVAGSFANEDNAVKEVIRLKNQGFPKANIVLSEKNLNLVSLGTFSDRKTAAAEAKKIKKSGINLFVKAMR